MIGYEHLVDLDHVHGEHDCYQDIRIFFKDNFNIELRNYAYPDKWWESDLNLIMKHYADEGFYLIDVHPRDLQYGDVFLMAVGTKTASHWGVYVGNGQMFHHPYKRKSLVEPWKGVWRNGTMATVRHRDVPPQTLITNTVEFIDMLTPSKRLQVEQAQRLLDGE